MAVKPEGGTGAAGSGRGSGRVSPQGAKSSSGAPRASGAGSGRPSGREGAGGKGSAKYAPKQDQVPIALWIALGLVGAGLIIFIFVLGTRHSRQEIIVEDPNKDVHYAKDLRKEGETHMRKWRAAQERGDRTEALAEWRTAKDKLDKAMDLYNQLLTAHADKNGDPLPGYEWIPAEIAELNESLHLVIHEAPIKQN